MLGLFLDQQLRFRVESGKATAEEELVEEEMEGRPAEMRKVEVGGGES